MVRLSEAEWKVMGALWEEAPQTIMQMTRRFQKTTGWTKHTIMTFLKRMEDKGAVRYEVGERAKLYRRLRGRRRLCRRRRSFWNGFLRAGWV